MVQHRKLLIIGLCALGIILAFLANPLSNWLAPPPNLAPTGLKVAVIKSVSGEMSRKHAHESKFSRIKSIKSNNELFDLDEVRTGRDSRALIVFETGYELELAENTHAILEYWDSGDRSSPVYLNIVQGDFDLVKSSDLRAQLFVVQNRQIFIPEFKPKSKPRVLVVSASGARLQPVAPIPVPTPAPIAPSPEPEVAPPNNENQPETPSSEPSTESVEPETSAASPGAPAPTPEETPPSTPPEPPAPAQVTPPQETPTEAPDTSAESTNISSTLSEEEITIALNREAEGFRRCQANSLRDGKPSVGQMLIAFQITPAGGIEKIRTVQSSVENDELKACVTEVIKRLKFRRFSGPPIQSSFPLNFE